MVVFFLFSVKAEIFKERNISVPKISRRLFDLRPNAIVPAASQGALGIQARAEREDWFAGLMELNDAATAREVTCERAALAALGGGCQAPVAVHARAVPAGLAAQGWLSRTDGREELRLRLTQAPGESAEALGLRLAAGLQAQGAAVWLAAFRETGEA
jgi:hydroxymethylbilane synthase